MKNFRLIKDGLNLDAVRNELVQSDLWVDMDKRDGKTNTDYPGLVDTRAHTKRIQLRTNLTVPGKHFTDVHETVDLGPWSTLTETRKFVLGFLQEIGGELGHVRATNLKGESEIPSHVDIGEYCARRDRYHLVITSGQGTEFMSGDETVVMKENELWWFDNKQMHQVKNLSPAPRIHLIFDILPPHLARSNLIKESGKFFKLINSGIDVAPLLEEVRSQEKAWLVNTNRQDKIAVQRNTNTINLRSALPRPDLNLNENQESRFTDLSKSFPKAIAFMTGFAKQVDAELSRATIVRLKPKSQVFRHTDAGSYYFIRNRYHLVLFSPSGSVLKSGDEEVRMQQGELWWFNNKQYHESYNESDDWRVHYIFDLLPLTLKPLAVNPLPPQAPSYPAPAA